MCYSWSRVGREGVRISNPMDNERFLVAPFSGTHVQRYDVFIGAIGYESRATHALEKLLSDVDLVVAAPFEKNRIHCYERNAEVFRKLGQVIPGDYRYRKELRMYIEDAIETKRAKKLLLAEPFRVCVDVSSMTRARTAETMLAIYLDIDASVVVDWVYSPAKYDRQLLDTGPVQFNDAIPGFEGWGDPSEPLHAVIGLGLEGSLVLGVIDDLEVTDTTVFEPMGFHIDYDNKITRRNANFVSGVSDDCRFRYNVTQPYTSFLKLAAVVNRLTSNGRVVLLPLGPKIFAVMCLLLGVIDRSQVTVWRLSADAGGGPIDRIATGHILGITAERRAKPE